MCCGNICVPINGAQPTDELACGQRTVRGTIKLPARYALTKQRNIGRAHVTQENPLSPVRHRGKAKTAAAGMDSRTFTVLQSVGCVGLLCFFFLREGLVLLLF